MLLRQLMLFVHRNKIYTADNHVKRVYETYLKLKRFRRTNAFIKLKNELMGIKRSSVFLAFASVRGTEYPIKVVPDIFETYNNYPDILGGNPVMQFYDDASWYLNGEIPNKRGRGSTKPIQIFPRETLGLDESYPEFVVLHGNEIISERLNIEEIQNQIICSTGMSAELMPKLLYVPNELKLESINPIPEYNAYSERRLGKLTMLRKDNEK